MKNNTRTPLAALSLLACLSVPFAYAMPQDNTCRQHVIASFRNLHGITIADGVLIASKLQELLSDPKSDAYALSMPLLVSAQLGDKKHYSEALTSMQQTMASMESGPFKAWLYGRMVVAVHTMKDTPEETKTLATLDALLESLLKNEDTRQDRFTVWSLGYVAALDPIHFNKVLGAMITGAKHLNAVAQAAPPEKKQETLSDALWAWSLISQAAAYANNDAVYRDAVHQMSLITQQSTLGEALTKGLLRTKASNDYPAWAIAIVNLAAQAIHDQPNYDALQAPLKQSIAEAKLGNYTQEWLLAVVNAQMAMARDLAIKARCGKGS